jgi:tetratricopeptide (TPR) repeat protein
VERLRLIRVRLPIDMKLKRWIVLVALMACSCTIQSSLSNRYLTAEKLWTEKKYSAAVAEFDRIVKESPNSAIGLQALWRSAMTRTLFLNDQEEAIKAFETYLERASSSELAPEAQKEIADIYFSKLGQHRKAIDYYSKLLQSKKFSTDDEAMFSYRIARSNFLSNRILHSIELNEDLIAKYSKSPHALKAKSDLANSWYALGDSEKLGYAKALKLFQEVASLTRGKDEMNYVEAIFGEASTMEEMDQLEEAYSLFKTLENHYPAPNVIKIKMMRLEERMKKKRK